MSTTWSGVPGNGRRSIGPGASFFFAEVEGAFGSLWGCGCGAGVCVPPLVMAARLPAGNGGPPSGRSSLTVLRRADRWPGLWLASAWHVDEVAAAIESLVAHGGRLVTREGMQLSARALPDGRVDVIASRAGRPLPVAGLRALATQLGRPWSAVDVQPGRTPGLVHLLLTRVPDDPR